MLQNYNKYLLHTNVIQAFRCKPTIPVSFVQLKKLVSVKVYKMFRCIGNPHFCFPCNVFCFLSEHISILKCCKENNIGYATRLLELSFCLPYSYFIPFSRGMISFNKIQQILLTAAPYDKSSLFAMQFCMQARGGTALPI